MDVDEDDDFYAPSEDPPTVNQPDQRMSSHSEHKHDEDLEEGEEEDEGEDDGSDSDIDIITERKDGTKAAPPSQARYNEIRNIPQRTASTDVTVKPAIKKESSAKGSIPLSRTDLPAAATSKIDINAKPVYDPAGKAITQINIDEDLPDNDKPWRRPGTDISDYFNYGFDEFTWALYASKQETLRSEYNQDKVAQNNKKMFEDMNMMMAMGGMPGMPGLPTGPGVSAAGLSMPSMPGMEGIPPEMQAMMQQMMASGIDPTQMDPAAMFASMTGAQGGAGGQGAAQVGNQGSGFGAQQSFGQGQNQQQMGYGYEQGTMNGNNRGNFRGRGRGHRNW